MREITDNSSEVIFTISSVENNKEYWSGTMQISDKIKPKDSVILGRAERTILAGLLRENEEVFDSLFGFYPGGAGVLAVTSERVLLIDKQRFFLHIDEVTYSDIVKIHFSKNPLQSSLFIKAKGVLQPLEFKSPLTSRLNAIYFYAVARSESEAEHIAAVLSNRNQTQSKRLRLLPLSSIVKIYKTS